MNGAPFRPGRALDVVLATLVAVAALSSCTREADVAASRTDSLVEQLRNEWRAASAANAASATRDALAPLVEAVERIAATHAADRERVSDLATHVQRITGIVVASTDRASATRAELDTLAASLARLQQELGAARVQQAADRELVRKALDATVERLDAWMRAMPELSTPTPAPSLPDATPKKQSEIGSSTFPWVGLAQSLLLLIALAGLAAVIAWRRRRRRVAARAGTAATPTPSTVAVVPPAVTVVARQPVASVEPPVPPPPAPPVTVEPIRPLRTTLTFRADEIAPLREALRIELESRREVLLAPAPTYDVAGGCLVVTFATAGDPAAAARVAAELHERSVATLQRRRQSDSPAA